MGAKYYFSLSFSLCLSVVHQKEFCVKDYDIKHNIFDLALKFSLRDLEKEKLLYNV